MSARMSRAFNMTVSLAYFFYSGDMISFAAASSSGVPGAAQHEVVRCRPGTVTVCGGPGSAVHRSTSFRAALHPGHALLEAQPYLHNRMPRDATIISSRQQFLHPCACLAEVDLAGVALLERGHDLA